MQTDVPLKTLTQLCPADLLALLGVADATALGVDSRELPTTQPHRPLGIITSPYRLLVLCAAC